MGKYKGKIQKEYHLLPSELPVYQELRTFFHYAHLLASLRPQEKENFKLHSCILVITTQKWQKMTCVHIHLGNLRMKNNCIWKCVENI